MSSPASYPPTSVGARRRTRAKITLGAAAALVSAFLVVVALPEAEAATSDLDKITLSNTPTALSAHNTIAADGDNVVAAWIDTGLSPRGYNDLVIRRSTDGGTTWETRQNITLGGGGLNGAKHPAVAVRGQEVVIAFEAQAVLDGDTERFGNHDIHLFVSHDGGRGFQPRQIMVDDAQESLNPQVEAIDNDSFLLTWISGDGTLQYRRSDNGARTWAPAETMTRDAFVNDHDYLAVADGSAWIGWTPRNAGGARLAQIRPDGEVIVDEFSGGTLAVGVSVAAAGPVAVAAWSDAKGSEGRLPYGAVVRDSKGHRNKASSVVSGSARNAYVGDVEVDGGLAYVTWEDFKNWEREVNVATSADGGSWLIGRTLRPSANQLGSAAQLTDATPSDRRTPRASIDWTMPERYGVDADGDGLIDEHQDAAFIGQTTFPVDLNACGAEGGDSPITDYRWSVDGRVVTSDACVTRVSLAEGSYDATLTVRAEDGETAVATRAIVVRDTLVVSIGDSVASGEGVPDLPKSGDTPARWQNEQCHRSARSGPSKAALRLEQADPRSSVTFLHLACSGASVLPFEFGDTTEGGLLTPYVGIVPGEPIEPQVDAAERLTAGRQIDALTVSIGANDLRFSGVVKDCITGDCTEGTTAEELGQRLAVLPGHYEALDAAIDGRLKPTVTTITQYFDPAHDQTGGVNLRCVADTVGTLVTDEETTWAYENVVKVLNTQVGFAAAKYGWTFVDGIAEQFAPHGYCANENWIVQIGQSFDGQGDENGGFHPNVAGHEVYGSGIAGRISAALPAPVSGGGKLPAQTGEVIPTGTNVVLTRNVGVDRMATPIAAALGATPDLGTDIDLSQRIGAWAAQSREVVTSGGLMSAYLENTDPDRTRTSTWEIYGRLLPTGPPGLTVRTVAPVQAPDDPTVIVAGKATAIRAEIRNTTGKAITVPVEVTVGGIEGGSRTFTQKVGLLGGRNVVHLLPTDENLIPVNGEQLVVTVKVDTTGLNDENHADDELTSAALPIKPGRDLRIRYVPLGSSAGNLPSCREVTAMAATATAYLQAALPVRELGIDAGTSCASAVHAVRGENGDSVNDTLAMLNRMAAATGHDLVIGVAPAGLLREHMGYTAVGAAFLGASSDGGAYTKGAIVELGLGTFQGSVTAHELAHTWGLNHADNVGAPGFRVDEREARDGVDFMETRYTSAEWISSATFGYLQRRFAGQATAGAGLAAGTDRSLLFSLSVPDLENPGRVRVSTMSVRSLAATTALGGDGTYQLRYLNDAGDVLATAGITPGSIGEHPEEGRDANSANATVLVPWVDDATAIQVRLGDDVVAEEPVSAQAPVVQVQAPATLPAGSDLALTWSATDADTDTSDLRASVEMSTDGGRGWIPVADDLTGTTANLPIGTALAGSAVHLRVVVSDGVRTGEATAITEIGERPKTGRIAVEEENYFTSGGGSSRYSLVMLDPATNGRTLIQQMLQYEPDPDWSPDGKRLAWIHLRDLVTTDQDGNDERILAYGPANSSWMCPDWSPDGKTIATIGEGAWITGITVATGEKFQLIAPTDDFATIGGSCPYWSPDGKQIAFRIIGAGYERQVWTYTLATKSFTRVTTPQAVDDFYGWSLDGELLVEPAYQEGQTYAVKPDGTGWSAVTELAQATQNPDGRGWLAGKYLGGYRDYDIALLDEAGAVVRTLTDYDSTPTDYSFDSAQDWDWQPLVAEEQPEPTPAPTLADAGGPYEGVEGDTIVVDATAGSRPNGEIPIYTWDLDGDGEYDDGSGASVPYVVPANGGTVAVRALLDNGTADTDQATVTAHNALPTIGTAPLRAVVGVPTQLDSVVITDADGPAVHTEVDWGDGTDADIDNPVRQVPGGWSPAPTHTYTEAGTYTVGVWAQDEADEYSWTELTVTVLARPAPAVGAVWPEHGPAAGGTQVRLTGELLGHVDEVRFGDTPATSVEVLDDGTVLAVAPALPAGTVADVRVVDHGVVSAVTSASRWVVDDEPASVADVSAHTSVQTPVDVALEVRNPDGGPEDLAVVAGPTSGAAALDGTILRFTPAAGFAGTVTIGVRAGNGAPARVTIVVGSRAPVPGGETLYAPAGTGTGATVRFPVAGLLANDADAEGDALTVTAATAVSGGTVGLDGDELVATLSGPGPITFSYTVRDATGMTATATSWVALPAAGPQEPAPTADAGADVSGTEGTAVPLAGVVSDQATAVWTAVAGSDVDSGASCAFADPAAASTTVTCTDDGTWTLKLTATSAGGSATDEVTLTLANRAPEVTVTSPTDGLVVLPGENVPVSATVADAGGNDTATVRIDAGDGSAVRSGTSATLTYAKAGIYTITVTASDDDGATGSAQVTVVVRDAAATGGWVLGAGQIGDGARVAFAAYRDRTSRGVLLLCAPNGKHNLAGIVTSVSITGTTAKLSGGGVFDGKLITFKAVVTDGGIVNGKPAKDVVELKVFSLTGSVLWSSNGGQTLQPGAAMVKAS